MIPIKTQGHLKPGNTEEYNYTQSKGDHRTVSTWQLFIRDQRQQKGKCIHYIQSTFRASTLHLSCTVNSYIIVMKYKLHHFHHIIFTHMTKPDFQKENGICDRMLEDLYQDLIETQKS